MNRTELIAVIAVAFFLMFAAGWVTRWLYGRLKNLQSGNLAEFENLASKLLEAEEQRDQAVAYLQHREWELTNQLGQAEAELNAAMEGLGNARREAEHYRQQVEGPPI